jgi:hypothetical protein
MRVEDLCLPLPPPVKTLLVNVLIPSTSSDTGSKELYERKDIILHQGKIEAIEPPSSVVVAEVSLRVCRQTFQGMWFLGFERDQLRSHGLVDRRRALHHGRGRCRMCTQPTLQPETGTWNHASQKSIR